MDQWPCRVPASIDEANAQAAFFMRACGGQKMMLNRAEWAAFEAAEMDMDNFALIQPIPVLSSGSIWLRR